MKAKLKNKLITTGILIVSVIAVVEFQKHIKNQSAECVDGICKLPSEQAGALVGPQSVPMMLSETPKQTEPLPHIIEFGSVGCTACKMMSVVLDDLAGEYKDRLAIRFIDARQNPKVAEEYSIRMIPTQLFIDAEGNELFRHEGFISKEDIQKKWAELGVEL